MAIEVVEPPPIPSNLRDKYKYYNYRICSYEAPYTDVETEETKNRLFVGIFRVWYDVNNKPTKFDKSILSTNYTNPQELFAELKSVQFAFSRDILPLSDIG